MVRYPSLNLVTSVMCLHSQILFLCWLLSVRTDFSVLVKQLPRKEVVAANH